MCDTVTFKEGGFPCNGILFNINNLRVFYTKNLRLFPFSNSAGSEDRCKARIGDCIAFFMYFVFYFNNFFFISFCLFSVMLYYSYTQTFSLSLLYRCYSCTVSFCALLDGVCLSRNKRITYLLTYLPQASDYVSVER